MQTSYFDFADISAPHAALRTISQDFATSERLRARMDRGPVPTCAAAVLLEHGDAAAGDALAPLAAYLDPPDLAALGTARLADALAIAAVTPWAPALSRSAAIEHLAALDPTVLALSAVQSIAHRAADPLAKDARVLAADWVVRADRAVRSGAEKLTTRAELVRTWAGIRRQELQREVATGALHPIAGLVAGDAGFLANLVPPIADEARAALVPCLLANARVPEEEVRAKTFQLFHGRWRESARAPLSMMARLVGLKGRDVTVVAHAIRALSRLSAYREILAAVVSGGAEARTAGLDALERAPVKSLGEVEPGWWDDAVRQLQAIGEPNLALRIAALASRR